MVEMVTVNDVLDGHVGLDLECMDRIYLNGCVPSLQVSGQVASFMTAHLGYPIPSPAIMEKIGTAFRRAVDRFAVDNKIPVVRFGRDDRKIDRMRPYLARQAATGRAGVAAIGVAQEFAPVFLATKRGARRCGSRSPKPIGGSPVTTFTSGCDTRSHAVSGCVKEVGWCRRRSSGQCRRPVPALTCAQSPGVWGCEAQGKTQGPLAPSGRLQVRGRLDGRME